MTVTGQIDDLTDPGHLLQQHECCGQAVVVEGLHDVVSDDGQGRAALGRFVIARDAQRQIKLEPRALRQIGGEFGAAMRGQDHQNLLRAIGLRGKARIGAPAELAERIRGAGQHGAAMPVAIAPETDVEGQQAKARGEKGIGAFTGLQQQVRAFGGKMGQRIMVATNDEAAGASRIQSQQFLFQKPRRRGRAMRTIRQIVGDQQKSDGLFDAQIHDPGKGGQRCCTDRLSRITQGSRGQRRIKMQISIVDKAKTQDKLPMYRSVHRL